MYYAVQANGFNYALLNVCVQVTWTAPNSTTLDGRLIQNYQIRLVDEDGATVTLATSLLPDLFRYTTGIKSAFLSINVKHHSTVVHKLYNIHCSD